MTSEKSQVKNNGVSNVISPKQRKTKRSQLAQTQSLSPSQLNLTSSNKKVQSTEAFKDTPDIVCLSHLRWNFVYQRPQHLLSRCAQGKRVFIIEELIFSEEPLANLDVNEDSNGVVVVVPHLPQGLSEEAINADLQVLINRPVRKFKKQSVSGLGMVSVKARVNGIIRAR
ncbi:MAG: hypothetical protein V7K19_28720, partial [Nostoc sp.]